jgi:hypothetical protein
LSPQRLLAGTKVHQPHAALTLKIARLSTHNRN